MNLSGELKEFSLADILQLLQQQRKSGILTLVNGKENAEVFLSQGNIASIRVDANAPESKIKIILTESGRVSKQELSELETAAHDIGRSWLTVLEAKNLLTAGEKEEWVQIASEDMVCDLFSWIAGRYEFTTESKGVPPIPSLLNISAEFTCMEGMRRIDEWPRLREAIPDNDTVFRRTEKPYEGMGMDWDSLVLGLIDGNMTVEQIGKRAPFGSFRLHECLVNLWRNGYILPLDAAKSKQGLSHLSLPRTEGYRKTTAILGFSLALLALALALRLVLSWKFERVDATGSEASIEQMLLRENQEVLLMQKQFLSK